MARQLEQAGQPDARADADAAERDRQLSLADLVERILRSVPWLKTAQTSMLFMEHTGMVDALQLADSWLRPDGCDACIVLAVDSLTDPVRLPGQVLAALVRTPGNTHAYVPGEIGAAVVVMRREHVQVPLAHIQSAVSDREQQPNQARVYGKRSAFVLPPLTRCCAENHDDHRWSWQRPFALQSQGHGAPDFLGEGPVRRRHALRFGDGPGSERVVVRFSGKQSGTDLDKVADGVDPL